MPKSNTIRSTTSITRLIRAVPKPTYNGVRVSWCPRRKPAPAITINNAGNPAVEMRRYVIASATTAASAPKRRARVGASGNTTAATMTPSMAPSHVAVTPSSAASRCRSAPRSRATAAVVAKVKKMNTV